MAYLLVIIALSAYGVAGIQQAGYLLDRAGKSYKQLQAFYQLNSEIHHHFNRQLESLTQGKITEELETSSKQVATQFDVLRELVHQEIDLLTDTADKKEEAEELAHLEQMSKELDQLLERALKARRSGPASARAQVLQFYMRQVMQNFQDEFAPLLQNAISDERNELLEVEQEMQHLNRHLYWVAAIGVLVSLLAAFLLAWTVAHSFIRPVKRLTDATDSIADGRLNTRVESLSGKEFEQLSVHFNSMAAQLEEQQQSLQIANADLEHKVAERTLSLKESNERLKAVDKNRQQFLEDVSHELRSPATILLGEADVALRDPAADHKVYREALERILANAGSLRRRIEDLMALAHAEDGRLNMQMGVLCLNDLVHATIRDLEHFARINRINLIAQVSDEPISIKGDISWLRQLLMTLLDNAIKFSRIDGEVQIGLSESEGKIRLCVEDNGIGVSSTDLPNLFERYYQADTGAEQQGRGQGLGLAIARWIVEQHRGSIYAESDAGKGMRIIMVFDSAYA